MDDLRRLIEKAGGKFEGQLYRESVTMVASMESSDGVSIYIIFHTYSMFENQNLSLYSCFNIEYPESL